MTDVNHVVLIGRLTRDAELKYTASGKAVSKFSIAVNKQRKVNDKWENSANFFEVNLWGQLGESLDRYLKKGKQVAITGELNQERWEDNNGYSKSKVTVTVATVQLLGGASGSESGAGENNPSPPIDDGYTDDIPF
ncbi:MAG: single-stranded DNA-binding protein [Treponema sp.]|jgi:single-strand DNA-binding protein|nr:single-stranded DNA-binding protein [Treponema sp.]